MTQFGLNTSRSLKKRKKYIFHMLAVNLKKVEHVERPDNLNKLNTSPSWLQIEDKQIWFTFFSFFKFYLSVHDT